MDGTVSPRARAAKVGFACEPDIEPDDTIPIRMEFEDGDGLLLEIPFHNTDPEKLVKEGPKEPEHTIMAIEATTTMVIRNLQHIHWLKESYDADIDLKVKQLRQIPNYKSYSCLRDLAVHCRRMWIPEGDVFLKEGDLAEQVHYVVSGKVAIVKDFGEVGEKQLDVIGRGSCIGDWGVVNEKLRAASCITCSPMVEVLMISGDNFHAVADEELLSRITDAAGVVLGSAGRFGAALPDGVQLPEEDAPQEDGKSSGHSKTSSHEKSFKLISRRDKKSAGRAMLDATKQMSQEDRSLGISALAAAPPVTTRVAQDLMAC